ncbi:putative manganese transporter [Bacteroidota bacterium]|nr:putative manganese transporter [Bacteroidota bacterium]MDC3115499.1 putative manganese transporter [Bacteroidota bacterium]MDC3130252.1 putative manganese transporter [Bacteroidota bacterium]
MSFEFKAFLFENLEAAGSIAGYVSISIIGFALFTLYAKKKHKNFESQLGPKWAQPVVGAFLGAIPGCGATIVVASLYKQKKISFGGLLATFISTLGEGSFVLLGASAEADVVANVKAYAIITIFGLISGIIFGYISDTIGFRDNFKRSDKVLNKEGQNKSRTFSMNIEFVEKLRLYIVLIITIFLAPASIMALWGGSIESIAEIVYWFSIIFTVSCIIFYLLEKFLFANHDCIGDYNNIRSTVSHATLDVSMVVTYVFIGLFVANFFIDVVVGSETFNSWMMSSTNLVIFIAAVIGVLPGCGGMISVAVAFIVIPNFPISALIAAGIATSGDGLFPLLADNKEDGLIVSIVSFFVALLVGFSSLLLGL